MSSNSQNEMRINAEYPCYMEIKCTNTAGKFPRSMKFPRCLELKGWGASQPMAQVAGSGQHAPASTHALADTP